MRIRELLWPQERIGHIARHGILPSEVDEVCFGFPLVQRAKSEGKNPAIMFLDKLMLGDISFASSLPSPPAKVSP